MDTLANVQEREVKDTSVNTLKSTVSIKDHSTLLSKSGRASAYVASADGRIDIDLPTSNHVNLSNVSLKVSSHGIDAYNDGEYQEWVKSLEEDLSQILDIHPKKGSLQKKSSIKKRFLNQAKKHNPFSGSSKDEGVQKTVPQIVISNYGDDTEVILEDEISEFSDDASYYPFDHDMLLPNSANRQDEAHLDAVESYLANAYNTLRAAIRVETLKVGSENVDELMDAQQELQLELSKLRMQQDQDYEGMCMNLLHYYADSTNSDESVRARLHNIKLLLVDIAQLRKDSAFNAALDGLKSVQEGFEYIYEAGYLNTLMGSLSQASKANHMLMPSIQSGFVTSNLSGLTDIPGTLYDAYENYSDLSHLKDLYKQAKAYLKQEGLNDKDLSQILKLIKCQHDFGGMRYKIFVDLLKVGTLIGGGALAIFVLLVELEVIALPASVPMPPIAAGIGVGVAAIGVAGLTGYLAYKGGRKLYKYYKQKKWQHVAQHKGHHYEKLREKYSIKEIDSMAHSKLARHDPYYSMLVLHDRLRYQGRSEARVEAKERTENFLKIFGFNDELLNDIAHVERNTAAFLLATKLGFNQAVAQL